MDLLHQMVRYYQFKHCTKKWWRSLFFFLLAVRCYNAYISGLKTSIAKYKSGYVGPQFHWWAMGNPVKLGPKERAGGLGIGTCYPSDEKVLLNQEYLRETHLNMTVRDSEDKGLQGVCSVKDWHWCLCHSHQLWLQTVPRGCTHRDTQ